MCNIFIETDTDKYKNLVMVMKYIQIIIGLPLILSNKHSGNIKWYVNTDFALHKDMRSYTGVFMTIVTGGEYLQSRKQKLNTKSSTEAEFFGVDDVLT